LNPVASHVVKVRVSTEELRELDRIVAERGTSRAAVLRSVLDEPRIAIASRDPIDAPPSRERALELLALAAEGGSVTAAGLLERALRLAPPGEPAPAAGPVSLDEAFGGLRAVE
jgi:hypothetical protein